MSTWRPAGGDDDGVRRVGRALEGVLGRLGAGELVVLRDLVPRWEEAVGSDVARHARPVAVRGKRLVVAVDQPGWATQLRWLEAELLARVAAVVGVGAVTALDVRVEGGEGRGRRRKPKPSHPPW